MTRIALILFIFITLTSPASASGEIAATLQPDAVRAADVHITFVLPQGTGEWKWQTCALTCGALHQGVGQTTIKAQLFNPPNGTQMIVWAKVNGQWQEKIVMVYRVIIPVVRSI